MINGLKRYNVFLYEKDNDVLSDCLLETDNYSEAKYLCTELGHMCDKEMIRRECSDGTKEPYDWAEVYDNEAEDTVFYGGWGCSNG